VHRGEEDTRSGIAAAFLAGGTGGRAIPPARTQTSATVDRRQTVSSPATTALPTCGICRPLRHKYDTTVASLELGVDDNSEEPPSVAVEVDSEHFIDVAVGTDRPVDTASSHSSDWLSSRHHGTGQPITIELEPRWMEIGKFSFHMPPNISRPAE